MKNEDGPLQSTLENSRWSIADNRTLAQVNGTQVTTTLDQQMPLPRGVHLTEGQHDQKADQMSS